MRQLSILLAFLFGSISQLHAQQESSKLQATRSDTDTDTGKLHLVLILKDTTSQYLENTTSWFTDDSGRLALVIHRFGNNPGSVSGHRVSINYYHFSADALYKIVFVTTNLGKEEISRRILMINSTQKSNMTNKKSYNHHKQRGEDFLKTFKQRGTKSG